MISQKTHLETEVNGKKFGFHCECTALLQETLSALDTFRSYIYGRMKEAEDMENSKQKAFEPSGE